MKKRIIIPAVLALTLAAVGLFGIKAYNTVSAQTVQPNSEQTAVGHGIGGGSQYLADALGITLDELNTARENAYNAGVDEALAQGLITQTQADDLKARSANMRMGRGWEGWLSGKGIDFESLLAKELNITVEELSAARVKASDAAIEQAVTDGRITQEQADLMKGENALSGNEGFLSTMKTALTNAINQAVQSGVITQAQADALLNRVNTDGYNPFGGHMRGFGFGGGRRGMHEFSGLGFAGPQFTPPAGTQSTPSTGL
jgi:hypothetical protein